MNEKQEKVYFLKLYKDTTNYLNFPMYYDRALQTLQIENKNTPVHMMYLYIEQCHRLYESPISMYCVFFENGPQRVLNQSNEMVVEQNPNSWTQKYNILYIDQPIAVGFSSSALDEYHPVNEDQAAEQFYKGLLSFYTYGCYRDVIYHDSPLFITGERYCGKNIPNIVAKILNNNNYRYFQKC